MAESVTIARPYAQAVFRLAREAQKFALWSDRLARLAAIAQDAQMASVIGNPKFSAGQVAELFMSMSGESGDHELAALVDVLSANDRLSILPQIQELYEQSRRADAGAKDAVVSSAYALDESQLSALVSRLEPHFGCKLQARVEVDATLIGGIKVVVGDQVLDASVRGKLEAMATALKN